MNNLDPDVAERPDDLVVYGGTGQGGAHLGRVRRDRRDAARRSSTTRRCSCSRASRSAVFRTHPDAPRVLIANANLVPNWATWETFRDLEERGLTMYGQMTAGSWIYIGTQGILQGTYETLAALAAPALRRHRCRPPRRHGRARRHGRRPAAGRHDERRRRARRRGRSVAHRAAPRDAATSTSATDDLDEALDRARAVRARAASRARIGLLGNAADVLPELVRARHRARRRHRPDLGARSRSTATCPTASRWPRRRALRARDPGGVRAPRRSTRWPRTCAAMLALQARGAVTFDYGNNIRAQAVKAGVDRRVRHPGLRARVHPAALLRGQGAVPLGGALGRSRRHPRHRPRGARAVPRRRGARAAGFGWPASASPFQGLPARICWLGYGERARFGLRLNELVRDGDVSAPIVIGRDHLDTGSVASPNRETEGMHDGSDAIADWPILNALLNASAGRDVGLGPPRRRRRHRLLASTRAW